MCPLHLACVLSSDVACNTVSFAGQLRRNRLADNSVEAMLLARCNRDLLD